MSYDALLGSKGAFICNVCHEPIRDGERVYACLRSEVNYLPGPKNDNLDPDCNWFVHFDWDEDHVYHLSCHQSAISSERERLEELPQ